MVVFPGVMPRLGQPYCCDAKLIAPANSLATQQLSQNNSAEPSFISRLSSRSFSVPKARIALTLGAIAFAGSGGIGGRLPLSCQSNLERPTGRSYPCRVISRSMRVFDFESVNVQDGTNRQKGRSAQPGDPAMRKAQISQTKLRTSALGQKQQNGYV